MRTFADKAAEAASQLAPANAPPTNRMSSGQPPRDRNSILHLQRTIGNRAVQRLLARDGGKPADINAQNEWIHEASEEEQRPERGGMPVVSRPERAAAFGGDTAEDTEGLALGGDPDSDGGMADAQGQSSALGGNATSISTADLSAATWGTNGQFKWWINWVTDGTSGWIVQRIDNTYSGTLADGSPISNASVGVTPSYYEAWQVDGSGRITGSLGATGNRDRWERPSLGALGSSLSLSMTGTVYWTAADPAASGFTSGGVSNAGSLLSSTSAPAGIGSALLTRHAYGTWSSTGAPALPGCFTS